MTDFNGVYHNRGGRPSPFCFARRAVGRIRCLQLGMLCAVLLACTSSRAESPLRIGWIDNFSKLGVSVQQVDALDARIQTFNRCGQPEPMVVLADCPADQLSSEQRRIEGACGRTLELPAEWNVAEQTRLLRGVWMAAVRPQYDQRQSWLARQNSSAEHKATQRWPALNADDVPCDVVVSIDDQGNWLIGCDFNLDLRLQRDEQFRLPVSTMGSAQIVRCGQDVLLLEADMKGKLPSLSLVCLSGSAPGQWSAAWRPAIVDVALQDAWEAAQWHLFACDNGPANLVAAMEAAAQVECDLVLVNLQRRKRHSTDVVRLLAELSRSLRLPVVVNVPTPLSPNYFVEPARLSVPDIAEFRMQATRPSSEAFEAAVTEALEQLAARVRATQSAALTGPLTQPDYYASPAAGSLSPERFARLGSLADDSLDAGSEVYAAQIPADAIDGRVVFPHFQAAFDSLAVTLYDRQGRRISGLEHSNGVRFDYFPPVLSVLARGGTVLATKQLFCHGKTFEAGSSDVMVRWRRGDQPVIRMIGQPHVALKALNLEGLAELPADLQITPVHQVSKLENVPNALVPKSVREAAEGLLNRSGQVATFWYRESPRQGDYTLRHLFQTAESAKVWPNRLLQYAVVYENGRITSDDHAIGDLSPSNPMTGWILLQAARPAEAYPVHQHVSDLAYAAAPELLQRWPPSRSGQHAEQWARIGDGNPLSPMWGLLQVKVPQSRQQQTGWLPLYDHDPSAGVILRRKQQGQTAKQVLQAIEKPDDDSTDIVAWRQHLLALDQPELRKQHLDRVVQTSARVLEMCKQSLGGLPAGVDPYYAERMATIGPTPGTPSNTVAVFRRPTTDAQQQVYAWAVDAVYRQVRAIGYRELPEVIAKQPIKDWDRQNEAYESAFYQLCGMVDIKDPRFVLTLVRYHRRRGEPRQAYEALKWHAYEGPSLPWYFKKERDLFRDSGSEPLARLGSARWFLREHGYGVPDRQP